MRALAALVVLTLACATGAGAHDGGSHSGFASRVSVIDPFLPGLLVQVVNGHSGLSIANLTDKTIVILDDRDEPLVRIRPGKTEVWDEPRVGANDDPPARPGLVRNWEIEGTADGEPFTIRGFLGYRPPLGANEGNGWGTAFWVTLLAAAAVALTLGAAVAVARSRKDS